MKAFEVDNTVFSLFVTFDVVVLAAGNSEHLTVCIRCGTEAILFTPWPGEFAHLLGRIFLELRSPQFFGWDSFRLLISSNVLS